MWFNKQMRVHHGTATRIGDMVYASSGEFRPAFLLGANVKTGKMTAKQRGFAKANLLAVEDDLILLDPKGVLAIVHPSPDTFIVKAQAPILTTRLDGSHPGGYGLYASDRKEIVALDLSP